MLKKQKKSYFKEHAGGFIWVIIPIGIVLFVAAALASYVITDKLDTTEKSTAAAIVSQVKTKILPPPTPTPFLFQEMTIPSLRNREYVSELEELEPISENSNFKTFLTSYDSDGFKVNGLLTIPESDQPAEGFPAVVFVHGYIPPQEYKTTKNYASYIDELAGAGLVVFKIDLRGHDQSQGEAYGAYYSEDYIVDTLNAYSALQNADFVDPDRVGLWGHSMAGNVVFRSLAAKPSIPKVVVWAGAVYTYEDFSDYRISDNSYQPPPQESERRKRRDELFETYGGFDPASEFWQRVPATNYLEGISGEIQVHHAIDDNTVSIGYSRNLMSILDETDIEHELFEYASGGHNITGASFVQAMQTSSDFFKK